MIKKIVQIFFVSFILIILIPKNYTEIILAQNNGKKIETIILDAGHGGKDPGTIGLSGVFEKNIVLSIALKLKDILESEYSDLNVILTRAKDEFIELKDRGKIANDNNGNLFLSLHANYKKNDENDKNGFEIYILDLPKIQDALKVLMEQNNIFEFLRLRTDTSTNKFILASLLENGFFKYSRQFASIIQYSLATGVRLESRGVFQAGYYVLYGASMPSVLVECGYLSNINDEEYLKSDKGQTEVAKSIYKAIRLFKFDYDYESGNY